MFYRLLCCVFRIHFQTDLLSEAKYAEKLQSHPAKGPSLMSFVWGGMQVKGEVCLVILIIVFNLRFIEDIVCLL
jgi:hypothetical protein